MPVSIEIVVVLPAPLWPNNTNIWSEYMLMDRSFTACMSPLNILFKFFINIAFLLFYIYLYLPSTDSISGSPTLLILSLV